MAYTYRVPITYFWSDDPIPRDEERDLPLEEAMGLRRRIIGVLLRQARMEAGHSQKDLAKVLDCPSGRITSYEFGRTDIPLLELEKLASHLEVPLSYFLDHGIRQAGDQVTGKDELERLAQLPEDVRSFMLEPGNLLYVRVAMQLSTLSAEAIRNVAETKLPGRRAHGEIHVRSHEGGARQTRESELLHIATDDQTSQGMPQQDRRQLRLPVPGTPPQAVQIRQESVKGTGVTAASGRSAMPAQVEREVVESSRLGAGGNAPVATRVLAESVHGEQAST